MTSKPLKNPILHQILREAQEQPEDHPLLAIFDLDSTLFDVEPRVSAILKEFAHNPEMKSRYAHACQVISKIEKLPREYHMKNYLATFGLHDQEPQFYEDIYQFWKKRFFDGSYLKHDLPYPGAVEYVTELAMAGAEIVYLTGRDVHRMGHGTREGLLEWAFPLDDKKFRLELKPHHSIDDAEYKRDLLAPMSDANRPIYFFENELANIELVVKHAPKVRIVFFDSIHSGVGAPLIPGTPTIEDFLLT